MKTNIIYQGAALDVIKNFPDKSINSIITSPPYWQLRDYGWDGQWGLEPTYQMYLENLWSLMDEIYRVLADDGTCWINLGDSYSAGKTGSVGCGLSTLGGGKATQTAALKRGDKKPDGIPDKCLLLIPHRFAIGCIDRGWIMRNDIVWAKPNGMPESVTDRFSKKHEYFFFMTKSTRYYFDLESIGDKHKLGPQIRNKGKENYAQSVNGASEGVRDWNQKGYKNPGSVSDFWQIPTKGSNKQHFATYNTRLIDKPIIAGCPKGGVVLDPFCGTGTTLIRAYQLGRKVIGIEGSAAYSLIANVDLQAELSQVKLFEI